MPYLGLGLTVLPAEISLGANFIGGMILSRDAGDVANDVNVTAGECRDTTDAANIVLASEMTKQMDVVWAVGDDAGGLDTGTESVSTLYAVWAIKRSDNEIVDILISLSFTAPTMPTNYDLKQLIGAVYNDSAGALLDFTHSGNYFRYTGDILQEIADATIVNNVYETGTLSVPPSSLAHVYGFVLDTTASATVTAAFQIRTKGAGEDVTSQEAFGSVQSSASPDALGTIGQVLVDINSQIEYAANENGDTTMYIRTLGFTMLTRGRG